MVAAWFGVWTKVHFSDPASSFADKSYSDSATMDSASFQNSLSKRDAWHRLLSSGVRRLLLLILLRSWNTNRPGSIRP
jgi:hypothetical protein